MAKRKQKKYRPQPMAPEIQERFQALMKPKPRKTDHIDRKYYAISVNPAYMAEADLKF